MRSIKTFWQRIIKDIKQGQNLELYVVSFFALLFAVLTLVGDLVPDSLKTSAILAALALLVFNITLPHQSDKRLDDYLDDRSNYKEFKTYLEGARRLWIYAPSAANILRSENVQTIRKEILSHPDGEFRILIQDPDQQAAVDILIKQLDDSLDYKIQHLLKEIHDTLTIFELIQSWPVAGKFDYGLLDYGPGYSLVVIDPHKKDGKIFLELHGFHNESTASRMHITITKEESERWFTYWSNQFEYMWRDAQATDEA